MGCDSLYVREAMKYEIHYLPFAGMDDDDNPKPAREMRNRMELDDHTPTDAEVADLWEKQTEGNVKDDDPEKVLNGLSRAYNRGPDGYAKEMDEKEMRSLSAGDIIVLDGEKYIAAAFGWEKLGDDA